MRFHRIAVMAFGIAAAGCQPGANPAMYQVATSVQGATLQIQTSTGRKEGELLSVRDDGVIVFLRDGRVALVPWSSTTLVVAKGMGREYQYGSRIPPYASVKKNLILVSHYPQGMTPEIQARVLASKGQAQLVMLQ